MSFDIVAGDGMEGLQRRNWIGLVIVVIKGVGWAMDSLVVSEELRLMLTLWRWWLYLVMIMSVQRIGVGINHLTTELMRAIAVVNAD